MQCWIGPGNLRPRITGDCSEKPSIHLSLMHTENVARGAGLYTGFLPRGGELGVCQKEGGEAVRSCRAAAGGWVYLEIQGGQE